MTRKFFIQLALITSILITPAFGTITYVNSQAGLGSDSSVNWSGLGPNGTLIGQNFATGGVNGSFATNGGGILEVVGDPGSPSYPAFPGFNNGDTLLVSEDTNQTGTGPLTLLRASSVSGLGAYVQVNSLATFTAQIVALGAGGSVLGSGTFTSASDGSGNPVFMGVSDSVAGELFGIQLSITTCAALPGNLAGCSATDFATDTLFIRSTASGVPEPGSLALVGMGLAAVGWFRRKTAAIRN